MAPTKYYHSVQLNREKCQGCVSCVKLCPTEAIRVRNGKAEILADRCIDCGACASGCPYHAFTVKTDMLEGLSKFAYNIVLPAPSLYSQFPANVPLEDIWQGLQNLGFDEIFDVSLASEYIAKEIESYLKNYTGGRKPLISSTCPAVMRLIQVKFPELIKQVVPVLAPVEAAAIYVKREAAARKQLPTELIGVWFISPCPSKETNIRQSVDVQHTELTGSFSLSEIYGLLLKNMGGSHELNVRTGSSYGLAWGTYGGELASAGISNGLAIHGIDNVYEILEQISMNKMPQLDYVECNACQGGCLGGLLTAENKFVAESNLRQRIRQLREQEPADRQKTMARTMVLQDFPGSAAYRKRLVPRPMMQLDDDIMEAMKKFERMEEVLCSLPGLDCGACGAPSCQGLAEDIVQGKAHEIDCIFKLRASVHKLSQGMLELAKQIPIYHEPKMLNNTEDEDYEG
ncbi:[Fe-Fe] hydrogenase large subunit C-terminal domain-containing protein [Phascolarctobacterium sp.]|uniref:[Fe-Fe] hydrogenase large subunit C-terminal domain-containing protein n=1 Tax=Phascolarctobacterium sp. TaxID=2049039 RepID=UPI002A81A029|nr:[Fe-Fe] hydrogenase large subunit C-terminal domain-containing protein [Phascolarctobacterium sp.]MDY5046088.1 [Fe-Fe] hydrogenase large subunit C-terminal domain-containing protein [Phascolarctobacterium sp.]